ncbi:MAG: hypothetical protein M9921_13305 [Fimbriimonadaceae bacterium]|nr:hypothetical protein [Fimbriimonadaceae bacterium]
MATSVLAWVLLLLGPSASTFWGDYRTVTALAFDAKGTLWAATRGGLVAYDLQGGAKAFGWNGLLEGRGPEDVWIRDGIPFASTGASVGSWEDGHWVDHPELTPRRPTPIAAEAPGFRVPDRPVWPESAGFPFVPPPGTTGTHVSAVAGDARLLIAAWYGDGLWVLENESWRRLAGGSRPEFAAVRSLAWHGNDLALATFDGDVWIRAKGKWKHRAPPPGPGGSVYGLTTFDGRLFASTFEEGLAVLTGGRWAHAVPPSMTGRHPRELVEFQGKLYVRQSTGEVDRFDRKAWTRNVFPWLLRGSSTCLGDGEGRLLVGQFGGWSEFDGQRWSHFLDVEALQGQVVTALASDRGMVWVGTQQSGVVAVDRKTKSAMTLDLRSGLGDDWVRRILADTRGLVVGLFLSGAYVWQGTGFARLTSNLEGEATGLARNPSTGTLYVGSRDGLWRVEHGVGTLVELPETTAMEVQALHATPLGLWVGMPSGLGYLPWAALGEP